MQLEVLHSQCHWKTLIQTCRIYTNAAIYLMKDAARVQYSLKMMHPMKRGLLIMFLCSLMICLWSFLKRLSDNTQIILTSRRENTKGGRKSKAQEAQAKERGAKWPLRFSFHGSPCPQGVYKTFKPPEDVDYHETCWGKLYLQSAYRRSDQIRKVKVFSAADSIVNVEKFLDLFQVLLNEEQRVTTDVETIAEKIFKLQSARKQLNRVQIITDSLKNQTLYIHQYDIGMSERIHDLLDKFDYIKAYVELRQHLLTLVEKQFLVFVEQGMELKIWLSEAVEFQEDLHDVMCDSHLVVQKQLSQTQVLRNQSTMIAGNLEAFKSTATHLMSTLQELGSFSDRFQTALRKDTGKHQKWSDTLMNSVTEEMTQVSDRFSTVLKLNACYQTHLQGLLRPS